MITDFKIFENDNDRFHIDNLFSEIYNFNIDYFKEYINQGGDINIHDKHRHGNTLLKMAVFRYYYNGEDSMKEMMDYLFSVSDWSVKVGGKTNGNIVDLLNQWGADNIDEIFKANPDKYDDYLMNKNLEKYKI